MHHANPFERRTLLQLAAGLAAAGVALPARARADAAKPKPTGKLGDFDFLSGDWKIENRYLRDGKWDEFPGEAHVHGLLDGLVSVEELRIPARNFHGMGLRILDLEQKLWADYWVAAESGVLAPPPVWGSFVDGVGVWDEDSVDGEQSVIMRGVWDEITKSSCRWYSAVSHDDGKTWEDIWVMKWKRA